MSEGATGRKRFGRWLALLLLASVGLNLYFFGVQAGRYLGLKGEGRPGCSRGDDVRAFVRKNKDLKALARDVRKPLRQRFRDTGDKLYEARLGLVAALEGEPLSIEKVQAAQQRLGDLRAEMRTLRDGASAEFISRLTPDQRARLAEHMAQRVKCRRSFWLERRRKQDQRDR